MKTSPDRPSRVAADLLDAAAAEGVLQSRSAKQQLDHWIRVGRAVSTTGTAARRRVEAALAGQLPERDLSTDERAVLDAEVDAALSAAARQVRFGEVLAARGVTTVALGDDGVLLRHHPDGTTTPVV